MNVLTYVAVCALILAVKFVADVSGANNGGGSCEGDLLSFSILMNGYVQITFITELARRCLQ